MVLKVVASTLRTVYVVFARWEEWAKGGMLQGDIARSMKITRLYVEKRPTLEYPDAMHPIRDAELFAVIFKINLSVSYFCLKFLRQPPPTPANQASISMSTRHILRGRSTSMLCGSCHQLIALRSAGADMLEKVIASELLK